MKEFARLLALVAEHGRVEGSEAEITDLRELLKAAYFLLSEGDRTLFFGSQAIHDLMELNLEINYGEE